MSREKKTTGLKGAMERPVLLLLPKPAAPPPLIERLKNEKPRPLQIGTSSIFFYDNESTLIGRGASSAVFRGYYQSPANKCALKKVNYDVMDTNELDIWNNLCHSDHPGKSHVISFYECVVTQDSLYIAMELAKCNLQQELKYNTQFHEDNAKICQFLRNVFAGLEYLHDNDVLHRDIKPQNIFIFENPINGELSAKLGDLGLSRCLSKSEGSTSFATGTLKWMSPEALRSLDNEEEFINTKAMDIFSLGLVAYYSLCIRRHPFWKDDKFLKNMKDENVSPEEIHMADIPNALSAKHLTLWMLQKDPSRRPTIRQCRAHPFLWEHAEEKTLEFFSDILNALNSETEDAELRFIYNMVYRVVDFGITGHYRKKLRNSRISHVRNRCTWNWHREIEEIILTSTTSPHSGLAKKYSGWTFLSLVEFITDVAKNPEFLKEDVLTQLFYEEGKFSRLKFVQYFINKFPEMSLLLVFTLARISPQCSHLGRVQEKYLEEFVGCHEEWNHGAVEFCVNWMFQEMAHCMRRA